MNNLNLNLLKYFYYVAYYKGFTNASKQMHIVQSTFSYNVKTLEDLMGKLLIIRNSKNFELTEDGQELFETLKAIFGILENNFEFSTDNNLYQEITIGVRHSLSDFIFKDSIKEFIESNTNLHLNIKLYSKLDTNKFDEDYDILIDYEDYTNLLNNAIKEELCVLNNIIVCGKNLYNEYKNVNSLKELDNAAFITLCPNKKKGKFVKMCFENNIVLKDIVSINDGELNKKFIADNIGLALVEEESIKEELSNETIKKINISEPIFKDKIIIASKPHNNIIIDKCIKILKSQYNGEV